MNRLWVRLTAVFLLVALLAVGVVALAVSRITSAGFRQYVGEEAAQTMAYLLEDYYAATGSWLGVEAVLSGQRGGPMMGMGYGRGSSDGQQGSGHMGSGAGMGMQGGGRFLLADTDGRVLADTRGAAVGSVLSEEQWHLADPLEGDGEIVGWLVAETPGTVAFTANQQRFLEGVRAGLRWAISGAVVLAIVAGSVLAWQLARPLRRLTLAARRVEEGDIGDQVTLPKGSFREVTALTEAFNGMSLALAEGEGLRQRMAADIAHELRTPVSVMRAQLEGMMDGVLSTNAEHIAVVYNQTLHLARLVDDLRTLTMAEAGHLPLTLAPVDPAALIEQVVQGFLPAVQDAGLELEVATSPNLPAILADADRIRQVLANLIANALRHTDENGHLVVRAKEAGRGVRFSVVNSGDTLTPEQARHVFERFWRAEEARERDRGGAGLGLAISRELIHLHGGQIWVEPGENMTTFSFEIPVASTRDQSGGDEPPSSPAASAE
jgi:two-component system sensor histidine kinase BaeS